MSGWQKTKIGEFLKQYKNTEIIKKDTSYKLVTLSNTGDIYLRKYELGSFIKANKLYKIAEGSFIYSRLSIHGGAFGLVPKSLNDAVVTDEMPVFNFDETRVDKDFFIFSIKSNDFIFQLNQLTKGVGRVRIKENSFLNLEIFLPPLDEQKQIAKKLKLAEEKQKILAQEINKQKTYLKNLRKQILQDAIAGNLTKDWREANPTTESASELLKKIKQEKEKLIAEKKIKKEKPLPAINENEIPFDLPKNWVWVRLGEVIVYAENLDIQKKLNPNSQISYVDIDSIDNYNHRIMRIKYKKVSELSSRARRVLKKGFLLYSTVRPYLENIAFVDNDKENYIGSTGFNVFKTLYADLNYIFYFLLSPNLNIKLKELMIGFNSPSITNLQFESILVPLPPLAEQLAIVLKLQILMQKIDEAEQQIEKSLEYSKQLSACLLAEAFCKS